MTEKRELGPELIAEGWSAYGGDSLLWCHVPSRRCVSIEAGWQRKQCHECLVLPCEPALPEVEGCLVAWSRRDELGNPIFEYSNNGIIVRPENGGSVWTEHWADALRIGREMRRRILDSGPKFEPRKQLTFDELLEREP